MSGNRPTLTESRKANLQAALNGTEHKGRLVHLAALTQRDNYMSTRCQIKITYLQREVLLYHHWDGFPEGVGFNLIKRQKQLKTWNGNILVNELVKNIKKDDGYEIAFQVHTDLDYWYEIDCNRKTIRCWKVKGYLLSDHAEVEKGEEVTFIPVVDLKKKENKKDK